jgi:hypothetical protein
MATTAPIAAAIAVRFATGFSNIVLAPYIVCYNSNTPSRPRKILGHNKARSSRG